MASGTGSAHCSPPSHRTNAQNFFDAAGYEPD
jgi:hypothetical protein